jgi:hypothetical protein
MWSLTKNCSVHLTRVRFKQQCKTTVIVIPWHCLRWVGHPSCWWCSGTEHIIQASRGPRLPLRGFALTGLGHLGDCTLWKNPQVMPPPSLVRTGTIYLTHGTLPPNRLPMILVSLEPDPLFLELCPRAFYPMRSFGNPFSAIAGFRPWWVGPPHRPLPPSDCLTLVPCHQWLYLRPFGKVNVEVS